MAERAWMRSVLFALALLIPPTCRANAQGGILVQGVTDLEFWKTDSASTLLARGSGRPSVLARADIWAAYEPLRNVVLFVEGLAETGQARRDAGTLTQWKQYGLRYSPSDAFTFETGAIRQIVGTFSARQLSYRNPLVDTPDGYSTTYPRGARVDGSVGIIDYRAGVLSLPLFREGYVPIPSDALRPAFGAGMTPFAGLRFGMSTTQGPYLNDSFSPAQLRAQDWKAYKQHIVAADLQWSRGYFEGHAELAHSVYDVPGRPTAIKGLLYYLEPKYTFTPRFFLAGRYERNDYPFIRPVSETSPIWIANRVVLQDVEIGGGFRATAATLLKLSVRADHWAPNANPNAPHDNGYAMALQWSQLLDVVELFTRRQ
ncbi:MAG: hypothetical protein ABI664_04425 [bacterium]